MTYTPFISANQQNAPLSGLGIFSIAKAVKYSAKSLQLRKTMVNLMSELGGFHQVCGARCHPLYMKSGRWRRIRGLYFCSRCKSPTYAIDYRMTKTESEEVDPFQTVLSV